MKQCGRIQPLLHLYVAGELAAAEQERVRAHLQDCLACQTDAALLQEIVQSVAQPSPQALSDEQHIDWQALPLQMLVRAQQRKAQQKTQLFPWLQPFMRPLLGGAVAMAAIVAVVLFFSPVARFGQRSAGASLRGVNMADMETAVAQREIAQYLQQSEMMLTDVMQSCAQNAIEPWEVKMQSEHAKKLLQQKRFFNNQLDSVTFTRLKSVCERIDSVCYELVSLPREEHCEGMTRIREMLKKENTLLKVRLLEREIAAPQFSEV